MASSSGVSTRVQHWRAVVSRPMTSYYLLIITTVLLLLIGLVMVLSASSIFSYEHSGNAYRLFWRHTATVGAGIVMFWVGLRIPLRWYRFMGYPLLLLSCGMLAILLLAPNYGKTEFSSTRWINLGFVQVQPSELAKLALALWGTEILIRKRALLADWKHLAVPLFPMATLVLVLVGKEDLGTMLCVLIILLTLLWVSGVELRAFALLVAVGISGAIGLIFAEDYRIARVKTLLDPFSDSQGAGHQTVQGLYALASGGWLGQGIGKAPAKWGYLPNAHNDFIFAIIGAELGILGCLVVVFLFGLFAYTGLRIARRSSDPFTRLAAATCTVWITGQAIINICTVIALVPITGIPLPLISYGGTSMVVTLFVIGMLVSFARAEPEAAAFLHNRRRSFWSAIVGLPPVPVSDRGAA